MLHERFMRMQQKEDALDELIDLGRG